MRMICQRKCRCFPLARIRMMSSVVIIPELALNASIVLHSSFGYVRLLIQQDTSYQETIMSADKIYHSLIHLIMLSDLN